MADAPCSALGIPEHLHREERAAVPFDAPAEFLFRRFHLLNEATVTACLKFNQMSVNRERVSTADETLLNSDAGGMYEDCGVVALSVDDLHAPTADGCWRVEGVPGAYELRPEHKPARCNYSHAEVIVFKDGAPQHKIKPVTVKLAIRRDLARRMDIRIPIGRAGEKLPIGG